MNPIAKAILLGILVMELIKVSDKLLTVNREFDLVSVRRVKQLIERIERILDDLSDGDLPGGVK